MNYEQQDITTIGKDGQQIVTAHVASNGLAYHRTLVVPLNENTTPEDRIAHVRMSQCWSVTHVASGNSICWETHTFDNDEQCRNFIDKVDGLTDWTAPHPSANQKTKQAIRRIAIDCQYFDITYL